MLGYIPIFESQNLPREDECTHKLSVSVVNIEFNSSGLRFAIVLLSTHELYSEFFEVMSTLHGFLTLARSSGKGRKPTMSFIHVLSPEYIHLLNNSRHSCIIKSIRGKVDKLEVIF
jgi:hypothetical protein